MGVSKNRKGHKAKVQEFKNRIAGEKKRAQEALMKMYQEQMAYKQSQMKQQVNGVDVENTDIDVDVDLGDLMLGEETPVLTDVPVIEESLIEDISPIVMEEPKPFFNEESRPVFKEQSKGVKNSSKKTTTNKKM